MVAHKNRVQMTVSGTPGTGTITLGSASSGYQSFSAAHGANATVDVLITDGTAWEVARSCTYTHSGTTLSRGTLEASSTGSAISLTSSAVVAQIPTAQWGNWLESAMQAVTPGGRLTLESGVPVSTTDQTAKTTIYYTPYVHDTIPLWDGARWVPTTFSETSEALGTLTSGLNYDVFGFLSSGVLDLEKLAWTNDSTRATAVTLQDGRYCKSGDKTRLLLGTFRTTSTTTTEDSAGGTSSQVGSKRFVSNVYNKVQRHVAVIDTTDSWTYNTTTWRRANGASGAGNALEFVSALGGDAASADMTQSIHMGSNGFGYWGVNLDSDSARGLIGVVLYTPAISYDRLVNVGWRGIPGAGYHYLSWLERGGAATVTRSGDGGESGLRQAGMQGLVWT